MLIRIGALLRGVADWPDGLEGLTVAEERVLSVLVLVREL
jgi:hypothetical protein